MFCWSCGRQVKENLNYCSNCGARVEKGEAESNTAWMNNLTASAGFLGIFGLGGFIVLVLSLLKRNLPPSFVFVISALYVVTLFGICFMLFRHTSRAEKSANSDSGALPEYSAPKNFRSGITNQLESPGESIPSVTENTTRTLEGILVERK